jgi:hypothetical protein
MSERQVPTGERTWRFIPPDRYGLAGVALLLTLLPVFFHLPRSTQFMAVLQDFAHGPVFAAIAWITVLLLKRHGEPKRVRYRKYWGALAIAVVLGCAVELTQSVTGRDASLHDVVTDTLGAVLGLSVASLMDSRMSHRRHRLGISLACAFLCAGLLVYPVADSAVGYLNRARRMPDLLVPDSTTDMRFVRAGSASVTPSYLPRHWSDGAELPSLEIQFRNSKFSGVQLFEPYPDWRPYGTLALDVTNPGPVEVELTVRVHDATHNQAYDDRFNGVFVLAPATRQVIRIPLESIRDAPGRRQMDMSRIAGLGMFTTQGEKVAGERIYVTRIWLE